MKFRKRGQGTCALNVAEPSNPFIAFIDGDGDQGDGDKGGTGEKMLSQSHVTALIARETKAAAEKAAKEAEARLAAELKKRDDELERTRAELETAGKSAEERARIEAENRRKAELAAAEGREKAAAEALRAATERAEGNAARLTNFQIKQHLSSGLVASSVLATAHEDALRSFMTDSKVDLDDDGNITSLVYKGVAYATAEKAAAAFLKERAHFKAPANNGGTGARGNGGNGGGSVNDGKPLYEKSSEELLAMSVAERQARR